MALTWKKPEKPDAGHHTSIQVQSWRQRVGVSILIYLIPYSARKTRDHEILQ